MIKSLEEELENLEDYTNDLHERYEEKKAELAKVKKQLAIAIEALKCYEQENWSYADEYNYFPFNEYTGGWCHAEKALKKIKELDK